MHGEGLPSTLPPFLSPPHPESHLPSQNKLAGLGAILQSSLSVLWAPCGQGGAREVRTPGPACKRPREGPRRGPGRGREEARRRREAQPQSRAGATCHLAGPGRAGMVEEVTPSASKA